MAKSEKHHILATPSFATPPKLLVVRAPYYKDIGDDLLKGALDAIKEAGATAEVLDVPGALEIPPAIAFAKGRFDGFVALGCVIRGETTHYDTVCNDSSRALMLLGLQGMCIGNGILTVESKKQAEERANPKKANKGAGAAEAALHLIAAQKSFASTPTTGGSFAPDSEHIIMAGKE